MLSVNQLEFSQQIVLRNENAKKNGIEKTKVFW